jgi:putative acetyltransferase
MVTTYTLGWATSTDYDELGDVVFDAVRNGPSQYTEKQRAEWVPRRRSGEEWAARLAGQSIAIARDKSRIVGLMSLESGGYIDFAFIRPGAQGTGLFRRLFTQIEKLGYAQGDTRLWVHASLMAEPAFAAVGFDVVERQIVQIGSENFARALMEKTKPTVFS